MSDIDHIFVLLGAILGGMSLALFGVTKLEKWIDSPRRGRG
jgi:hypothetical protein